MIQFCHVRKYKVGCKNSKNYGAELSSHGGLTIAMEEIQPWLIEQLEIGNFIERKVGKARCSDEDNYNKKIGRELSLSRMKATKLTVVSVNGVGTDHEILVLKDPDNATYLLSKYKNATRVYFEEYNA